MKTKRLIPLLCLPALLTPAFAIKPKTDTTNNWVRVTDVERTDSALRMGVSMRNRPNYWVKVPNSTRLIASDDTTRHFKVTGAEGFAIDSLVWMPESGHYEGVLLFEPIPADVKVVDMVETDVTDLNSATLGIHLDEPDTRIRPKTLTMADIIDEEKSEATWSGLDPKRYADMDFYKKDGVAHLQGIISDYSPRYGVTTFTIRTFDDFTEKEKVHLGNINSDGSFAIDIPLTYPQFDYFELGPIRKNVFLMPGDTLSIATCMATKPGPYGNVPEYFGYNSKISDSNAVNFLKDSLINVRYQVDYLFPKYKVADTDSMKTVTYRNNVKLAELLDSIVNELPVVLSDVPVSGFVKDMLEVSTVGPICQMMEDLQMYYIDYKGPHFTIDDEGKASMTEGDTLDYFTFLRPWMKHKDLIYNNPILIATGMILANRWKFNPQFRDCGFAAQGMANIPGTLAFTQVDDIKSLITDDISRLDSLGLGNCFAAQLARSASFIGSLNSIDDPTYSTLERNSQLVARIIRNTDYDKLSDILMSEYDCFVRDVLIAENAWDHEDKSVVIPDSPEGDVLKTIIEPYKGNVLFLDFWGIGCGPCRAGMMHQKPILTELSDKPFKALYIANADEGLEACKKWLRNEEIQGEHIFVSGDDWKRLCSLFNISGIPHGVLIGKDGSIIKDGFNLEFGNDLLDKAISE